MSWSKFTPPVWLPDGSGFVYGRFDPPGADELVTSNSGMRVELHHVGTKQDEDEPVLALRPNPMSPSGPM